MSSLEDLADPIDNVITRLELIGPTGRVFSSWNITSLQASIQDDYRTLKIFFDERN